MGLTQVKIAGQEAQLVQDDADLVLIQEHLKQINLLAVDTETNWTEKWEDKYLMGFSIFYLLGEEKYGWYFPFRHDMSAFLFSNTNLIQERIPTILREVLLQDHITYLWHNAKFDMEIFRREGIECSHNFYDTMLMSHMVDEIGAGVVMAGGKVVTNHKLKSLAVKYISPDANSEAKMMTQLRKSVPWEQIPLEVMAKYACKDAELTYYLFCLFLPKLKQQELDGLWNKEREFSLLLGKIERIGIGIDSQVAEHFALQAENRMEQIRTQLGFDPAKPGQLAHRLYEGTELGGLGFEPESFSKRPWKESGSYDYLPNMPREVLSRLSHPEVSLVLEYRSLQKANSTWFRGFIEKADTQGRLHPTYKQHGTVTTRLSCSDPNMQQLPRRKDEELEEGITNAAVKSMLKPFEGYELWEFDVSQAEFRLAAIYGEEEEILSAYREGTKDFHQITADKLGIPRVAYDGTKREGKTLNFSMLYGAGPKKLAQMLVCSEQEATKLHQEFWEEYPKLRQAVGMATAAAQARGWVRLWTGRKRHFQHSNEAHKAFNSLIQGGVAEIIKESMLRVDKARVGAKMIAQVHDSLWFEIPSNENTLNICDDIKQIMEWPIESFKIPFPVDMKRIA